MQADHFMHFVGLIGFGPVIPTFFPINGAVAEVAKGTVVIGRIVLDPVKNGVTEFQESASAGLHIVVINNFGSVAGRGGSIEIIPSCGIGITNAGAHDSRGIQFGFPQHFRRAV